MTKAIWTIHILRMVQFLFSYSSTPLRIYERIYVNIVFAIVITRQNRVARPRASQIVRNKSLTSNHEFINAYVCMSRYNSSHDDFYLRIWITQTRRPDASAAGWMSWTAFWAARRRSSIDSRWLSKIIINSSEHKRNERAGPLISLMFARINYYFVITIAWNFYDRYDGMLYILTRSNW